MKTLSPFITVLSLLTLAGPSAAQLSSPPAKEVAPAAGSSPVERDGITVYRGQPFLVRHGRAALINRALVPEGQVLTWEGRLVPLPSGFSIYDNVGAAKNGFMVFGGQAYWLHNGRAALINSTVVPEGQVLTAQGTLAPMPSDFSGFTRDNGPAGVPQPLTQELGTQALPNQAGIPQALKGDDLQSGAQTPSAGGTAAVNAGTQGVVGSPGGAGMSPRGVGGSVNAGGVVSANNLLLNAGTPLINGIPATNAAVVGGAGVNANGGTMTTISGGATIPAGLNSNTAVGAQTPTANTAGGVPATTAGGTTANTAGARTANTAVGTNANTAGGTRAPTGNTAGGTRAPTGNTAGGTRAPTGNTASGTRAATGTTTGGAAVTGGASVGGGSGGTGGSSGGSGGGSGGGGGGAGGGAGGGR